MVEILSDASGRQVGSVRNESGKLVARDRNGARVGYFDPRTNTTHTMDGRKVAEGNSLKQIVVR
ncbi:hypothetical protein [Roseiterribacter gracilis]|uniref:Uncharacterized protein n=1 Tax=Roseiterribacter gracilis TaxID=2812848 RepID=A0A8S8X8F2_9PROT|nr:hypothetical protein TMPK1_19700 [Rhodospirillales bacterium TMPK1]